jgi:AraC family transcriptional regulator
LLQHYAVCPPQLRSYRGGLPKARLRRVLEYMQAHLDQELSLAALAAVVQMSPYYFSRLFKQSIGLSPHQYLLHQRVERAKHLLANPQRRIAEVSQELGFAAQSHFTTVFRKLVGTTPRAYQRQRGGNNLARFHQYRMNLKDCTIACGQDMMVSSRPLFER